ncbi:hypothetical protein [Caulobacter sp. DWR1-3-2b1]
MAGDIVKSQSLQCDLFLARVYGVHGGRVEQAEGLARTAGGQVVNAID